MRKFLHVGCGIAPQGSLFGFTSPALWQEIRLDIDASVNPDVLGSITDMKAVESESVDAVYSSHNIEHVYPHDVPVALSEFFRVLAPDGFLIITCPDLQTVCEAVGRIGLLGTLYVSQVGPIRPLDVLYGYQPAVAAGNEFMAHKGGFVKETLEDALADAGFKSTFCWRGGSSLWAVSTKVKRQKGELVAIAQEYFPH